MRRVCAYTNEYTLNPAATTSALQTAKNRFRINVLLRIQQRPRETQPLPSGLLAFCYTGTLNAALRGSKRQWITFSESTLARAAPGRFWWTAPAESRAQPPVSTSLLPLRVRAGQSRIHMTGGRRRVQRFALLWPMFPMRT